MNRETIISYARNNRMNPTKAEGVFWKKVRKRKLFGLKFYRQKIITHCLLSNKSIFYIADFYCHKLKLVIEIDGGIHKFQLEYDNYRTEIINALGLKVIRFSNYTVMNDWLKIERKLQFVIQDRL